MAKIDLEKFICFVMEYYPDMRKFYNDALRDQGLKYKDGQIVEIPHEPKFRVGDWVIGRATDNSPVMIAEVTENGYRSTYGGWYGFSFEEELHAWTIQDAKDGDVLFVDMMAGYTFIYKGVNSEEAILFSFIVNNDENDVLPYHIGEPNTGIGTIEDNRHIIYPATKEQRDLLFRRMREAGYEWDAEKKELKKIQKIDLVNTNGTNTIKFEEPKEELTVFEQQIENLLNLADGEGHGGRTERQNTRVDKGCQAD